MDSTNSPEYSHNSNKRVCPSSSQDHLGKRKKISLVPSTDAGSDTSTTYMVMTKAIRMHVAVRLQWIHPRNAFIVLLISNICYLMTMCRIETHLLMTPPLNKTICARKHSYLLLRIFLKTLSRMPAQIFQFSWHHPHTACLKCTIQKMREKANT